MKVVRLIALFVMALAFTASAAWADDPKPAEIIAKHLDSIGTKEKRDSVKTLFARGLSEFESTSPEIRGGGRAIVVSDPDNLFFVISLNSKEYPFEKIGYFHGNINIPFISPGLRSLLGAFIADHSKVLSDGLFTGVMSLRWPLLEQKRGKLTSAASKKVGDRKAYVLDFNVSGGGSSEFTIRLYFDAENYHHLRTEYKYEVKPPEATFGQQSRQATGRLVVTESFSDFREVDGLTLPHNYRVEFETTANTGPAKNIWGIKVDNWYINQQLAPDFFTFDVK